MCNTYTSTLFSTGRLCLCSSKTSVQFSHFYLKSLKQLSGVCPKEKRYRYVSHQLFQGNQTEILVEHYAQSTVWALVDVNEENQVKKVLPCSALVACVYNPSYSGGRDQEDPHLKSAQGNSSGDPISKRPITKKGWWRGSKCRP
jgi:hypothetical protein